MSYSAPGNLDVSYQPISNNFNGVFTTQVELRDNAGYSEKYDAEVQAEFRPYIQEEPISRYKNAGVRQEEGGTLTLFTYIGDPTVRTSGQPRDSTGLSSLVTSVVNLPKGSYTLIRKSTDDMTWGISFNPVRTLSGAINTNVGSNNFANLPGRSIWKGQGKGGEGERGKGQVLSAKFGEYIAGERLGKLAFKK